MILWHTISGTGNSLEWRRENRGYRTFEDFLAALKQGKRKNVRQERKGVRAAGLELRRQDGRELRARDWDAFHDFYLNTTGARFVRRTRVTYHSKL